MSMNSNEDQLNSRLSNIFSDIEKPIVFPGLKATSDLTGWIWEIDPRGTVIGCSPEIEIFTEIPASRLIGNLLGDFSDFRLESAGLPTDPHRAMLPTRLQINFNHGNGSVTATESFILAKVNDDGNIVSWRGITSVLVEEQPEVQEPEQAKEESKDKFRALATLDITPEIPQPDLSLSDIWRESSMDTAPLSLEDVLEEGRAFQSSLEQTGSGELRTFQVDRVPETTEAEIQPSSDIEEVITESVSNEPVEEAQVPQVTEDVVAEIESLETPAELPVEPAAPEVEEIVPIMRFGSEPPTEPQDAEQDQTQPAAEEHLPPHDEIETIRYSSQTFSAEIEKPESAEDEIHSGWFTEIDTPSDEVQSEWAPSPPADDLVEDAPIAEIETGELTTAAVEQAESRDEEVEEEWPSLSQLEDEQILLEGEHPDGEIAEGGAASDWVPEFKAVTGSLPGPISAASGHSMPQPESATIPTKPLDPEEILRKAQEPIEPPKVDQTEMAFVEELDQPEVEMWTEAQEPATMADVLPESGFDHDELPESEPIDTKELTISTEVEAPVSEISNVEFEQISAQDLPQIDQQVEAEITEVELPADTKELDMKAVAARAASEGQFAAFVEETSQTEEKISPLEQLPDLDVGEETPADQTAHADERKVESHPVQTGSKHPRRPIIDTGSLIPSLMRGQTPSTQPQTETLVQDFLQELDEDTIKIETRELETYTSSDGVELTISRGVQELLKIVDDNPNRVWKEDELRLVEQVHTQLELALENANLFQQTQLALTETDERARQLRLLNQMSEQINQTDDLTEIFNIVAQKARDIFTVDRAIVSVISDDRKSLQVMAVSGNSATTNVGSSNPIEGTPNQVVIRENRVFIMPGSGEHGDVKSGMTGPITTANTVIGTINLTSKQPNIFNDRDANLLTQLLSITNASVENRRLFDQIESALATTEEQARRLAELNKLSEKFSSATSIDEVFKLIAANLNKIIPTDYWGFASLEHETQTYSLHLGFDRTATRSLEDGQYFPMQQPLENTMVGKAARERRTITEFNCRDSQFTDVKLWSEHNGVRTAMATPIVAGDTTIGAIVIGSKQLSAYTVQEENILLSVASLSGSTIDNRQLLTQIQKRSQQLETSAEVSRVASTILDPVELLPRVVELIKDGFNLYYAGIFLVDETGEYTSEPGKWAVLRAGSGEPGKQMMAAGHKLEIGGESMIGTAVSSSQARIALNVGQEATFFRNPYLPNTRSEMALPLSSRGQVLGALSIQSELEDAFSAEDITALQTMADQLANAIENARLFEQTEIRAEELTVLNEMARGFSQSMVMDVLIENTYDFTSRLMDATNFYMVMYYPEDQFYEFKLYVEAGEKVSPPMRRVRLGDGLTDWIIKNKLPVLMPGDVETYLEALGVEPRDRMPKSWLGVPMLLGNEVTGVIAVQNYVQENVYNNHALDLLIAVSSQAAVAIDNARRFQETQTRARHEEILRRVTTQVHSTSDPDAILRTAVREVSDALGKPAFVKLAPTESPSKQNIPIVQIPEEPPAPANFSPDPPSDVTEWEER